MIGAFSYKGISSSTFDLVCQSVSRPLLPPMKSNLVQLPGSSGVYDAGGVEYDLRTIVMKIQYVGKWIGPDNTQAYYELRERARKIAAWLGGGTWDRLIITGEEDKYYYCKIEEDINLDPIVETTPSAQGDITFTAQPFAYAINSISVTTGGGVITNPGTRQIDHRSPDGSLFNVSIAAGGTVTLNGRSLTNNGSTTITVDNVNMQVFGADFSVLSGDVDTFLTLWPGYNYISGAVGNVTFRPMYY